VIPPALSGAEGTEAARFSAPRRILARRVAQWRDRGEISPESTTQLRLRLLFARARAQPLYNQHFHICMKTNNFILIRFSTFKKRGEGVATISFCIPTDSASSR